MPPPLPPDLPAPFAARPWAALPPGAAGAADRVPTMLGPEEAQLYLWAARDWATGAGALVDLGCYAGGSTALLAEGQRQAGRAAPVHGYDAFTTSDALKDRILYPAGVPRFDGPDMLPAARALLAPWPTVQLHRGRIEDLGWSGGAIEILAMDASKTAESMDAMAADFLPALIPGRSLVLQQDCLHWRLPWIAAQMALLSGCFRPVAHAAPDTVAYLCTAVPDAAALARAACAGLDDAALTAALQAARNALRPFGIAPRVRRLMAAVAANPGVRAAHAMANRPPQHGPNHAP